MNLTPLQSRDMAAAVRTSAFVLSRLKESLEQKTLKPHHPAFVANAVAWCDKDRSPKSRAHKSQLQVVCQELYRLPETQDPEQALAAIGVAELTLAQWRAELEAAGVVVEVEA